MSAEIQTREGLFKVMSQIAAEREAAKPLVEELLRREELPWDEEIPPEWKTAGFVDELTKAAAGILEKDPNKTLASLHFALGQSAALSTAYPSTVTRHCAAVAMKHIGYTHQYQGAFEEGSLILRTAARSMHDDFALFHERANVIFNLACVLSRWHRLDAAIDLVDACQRTYEEFGDRRRFCRGEILRAIIANYRGDHHAAINILNAIKAEVRRDDDLFTQSTVHLGLAKAYISTGRTEHALTELHHSRPIAEALGMTGEIDRIDAAILTIRMQSATPAELLTILHDLTRIRAAFLDREMVDDAGLVGLDMVDALLALDRRNDARDLAEQVVAELAHPGLEHFATQALAYLRELLPSSPRARAAVQHVRSYLAQSRDADLPRPFARLPEE